MHQIVEPDTEINWGPIAWAMATMIVIGLVANFVFFRPGWMVPGAALAGGVAAARSGFYQPSGKNGAIGVLFGMLVLVPLLAFFRASFLFRDATSGDVIFVSIGLGLAYVILIAMVIAPAGYIGAMVVDVIRKRAGGSVGY